MAPSLGQVSVKLSGRVLGTGTVHASCSQTCYVANTSAWCTGLVWGGCDNVTYACVTDYLLRSVTFMCTESYLITLPTLVLAARSTDSATHCNMRVHLQHLTIPCRPCLAPVSGVNELCCANPVGPLSLCHSVASCRLFSHPLAPSRP